MVGEGVGRRRSVLGLLTPERGWKGGTQGCPGWLGPKMCENQVGGLSDISEAACIDTGHQTLPASPVPRLRTEESPELGHG